MNAAVARRVLAMAAVIGALGCDDASPPPYQPTFAATPLASARPRYVLGVHPLHNPQRLAAHYMPLVDYLNQQLGDVELSLEASTNYAAFDAKLRARRFALALPNPYQTLQAQRVGYHVFAKVRNDDDFRGIVLVRRDSGIVEVADLRGRAVSYPAPTALAATMLPQWYFRTHGLDVVHDIDNRYVGSQESSIMSVYLGHTAAGATWPPPWRTLSRERPEVAAALEVRWETETLPNNSLVARDDVPAALVGRLRSALIEMATTEAGRAVLREAELDGFEAATDVTYEPVRAFVDRFEAEVRPAPEAK